MSRIITALFVALTAALLVPLSASAHPDHMTDAAPGLSHLFLDPYHLGLMAGAIVLSLWLRRSWRRRKTAEQRVD